MIHSSSTDVKRNLPATENIQFPAFVVVLQVDLIVFSSCLNHNTGRHHYKHQPVGV
jgi:hypothetical protein